MARKLRLEYPGACYHVINRGNYRADVFGTEGAAAAFESGLFEACAKSNWVLHAYVVMSNHYHLALETPEGNLVAGMQWLQATFANRFNKLRGERGHLFQGRYKALVVEPGAALGQVCHYIHLNPLRAGIVTADQLRTFRRSSYWHLWQPKTRPVCLNVQTALTEAGQLADTPAGRRRYADYLNWQAADGPAGRNAAYASMSKGWALGTKQFRSALTKDHQLRAESRAWESAGAGEIREQHWQEHLVKCMAKVRKTPEDARHDRKSAPWKVAIAAELKRTSQATNRWLAAQLNMGSPVAVSQYVGRCQRSPAKAKTRHA